SAGELLHPLTSAGVGDLAPRDVVSASMARRMAELASDHCYLDATGIDHALLEEHFPTFVGFCRAGGIDPERDWVPVSPTAHYTMGGVLTDVDGRTTLEGLMAVGEVGCSGLHGANRLASNSLLEGAVLGRRSAAAVLESDGPVAPRGAVGLGATLETRAAGAGGDGPLERQQVRDAMQAFAGVTRDAESLARLAGFLDGSAGALRGSRAGGALARSEPAEGGLAGRELANMVLVGRCVAALALRRQESRGAHRRADFQASDPRWLVRQVAQLLPGGELAVGEMPVGEMPVGEMPVGEVPVGEVPVGEMPVGEVPVGEVEVGPAHRHPPLRRPASSRDLDGGGGDGPDVGRPRAKTVAL
ncbi:MAG: FAD-binding protein, partial [Actinobacteria bacterium]|nr:FAD-binding protein [Actinomycetota bacterium]